MHQFPENATIFQIIRRPKIFFMTTEIQLECTPCSSAGFFNSTFPLQCPPKNSFYSLFFPAFICPQAQQRNLVLLKNVILHLIPPLLNTTRSMCGCAIYFNGHQRQFSYFVKQEEIHMRQRVPCILRLFLCQSAVILKQTGK